MFIQLYHAVCRPAHAFSAGSRAFKDADPALKACAGRRCVCYALPAIQTPVNELPDIYNPESIFARGTPYLYA